MAEKLRGGGAEQEGRIAEQALSEQSKCSGALKHEKRPREGRMSQNI